MSSIYHGDCIQILDSLPKESVDLVFADPPFNISLSGYDNYSDNLSPSEYVKWSSKWITACHRVLKSHGSIYTLISDEFAAEIAIELKKRFTMRNWCVWFFGFGQQTTKKFARTKQHLLYFAKNGKKFTWNGGDIRVPSLRQTKYGDNRAAKGGKTPDDIFDIPIDNACKECGSILDIQPDIWKISRVAGTFSERIKDADGSSHPCQLPCALLERIIKVSSNVGDTILDPFAGTGTTAAVAQKLNRSFITMDMSEKYCNIVSHRANTKWEKFVPPQDIQMELFQSTTPR